MVTYPEVFAGVWEERSFNDIGDVLTGLTYSPDNIRVFGKLVIRSSNVQNDRLVYEDNVYVERSCVNSEDIKRGDIIICVRNGSSSLIGKSAYADSDLDATFGAFMSNFRCRDVRSSRFVYYFTKSNDFKDFVKQILGATINQITKTDLKKVVLKIPVETAEQEAIASLLSDFDEHIDNLTELIEKKKAIRDGALVDLVSGKMRLKGVTIEWTETELGQVASYRKGKATAKRKYYVSTENINQGFSGITPYVGSNMVEGCGFDKRDTLMANIRPYLKKIWYANFSGNCSADVLVLYSNGAIDPKYLYYLVANDRFISYVMDGGIKGIKMPRGDKKYILLYPVRIPIDTDIQETIAGMLTAMDEEIEALEEEKSKLMQIREGAMDDLLTGRVRLKIEGGQ